MPTINFTGCGVDGLAMPGGILIPPEPAVNAGGPPRG
jgi:hypothetical protein